MSHLICLTPYAHTNEAELETRIQFVSFTRKLSLGTYHVVRLTITTILFDKVTNRYVSMIDKSFITNRWLSRKF